MVIHSGGLGQVIAEEVNDGVTGLDNWLSGGWAEG